MLPSHVRLLDEADLRGDPGGRGEQAQDRDRGRDGEGVPAANSSMPVKIGVRTLPNSPAVTSSVLSSGSTPIRNASPMARCAASVTSSPPR